MKFETLKSGKLSSQKRKILGISALVLVLVVSLVAVWSYAKYRVTQSVNIAKGTISVDNADLNIIAMYQSVYKNNATTWEEVSTVPTGATLATGSDKSRCEVNGTVDSSITIDYTSETGKVSVSDLTKKGTKCYFYFSTGGSDVSDVLSVTLSAEAATDTSISAEATVTSTYGVSSYDFAISPSAGTKTCSSNKCTFEGLTAGSTYTVSVTVTDNNGNTVVKSQEVTLTTTRTSDQMLDVINKLGTTTNQGTLTTATNYTTTTTGQVWAVADDDGTSYVYRGAPTDNWVQFGMDGSNYIWWRIVRINGDGTLRMIYAGTSSSATSAPSTTGTGTQIGTSAFNSNYADNAYVGYMYGATGQSSYSATHANTNASTIKGTLDTWYSSKLAGSEYAQYIDTDAGFCGDRTSNTSNSSIGTSNAGGYGTQTTYYGAYVRFYKGASKQDPASATLKCSQTNDLYTTSSSSKGNKALTYPVGLISADEVGYAGMLYYASGYTNTSMYLYTNQTYWTMSPSYYDGNNGYAAVFLVSSSGFLSDTIVYLAYGVRPVINLKSSVTISGKGTSTNPYTIS